MTDHPYSICGHCGTRHSAFKPCPEVYAEDRGMLAGPLLALGVVLGVPLIIFLIHKFS